MQENSPANVPVPSASESPQPTQVSPSVAQSSFANQPPPNPPVSPEKHSLSFSKYIIALITFLVGTGLGFLLVKEFPQDKLPAANISQTQKNAPITVPKDAVQIESCEDNKGTLFIKPQDIPQGPIYMLYKGKVIGLEFMLDLNQIMKDGKFDFLSAQDVHIDHIKFGYLSEGHEGNPTPHFHADLYIVPKAIEEAIKCPPGSSQLNMPGMNMSASSSAGLTPVPSAMKMLISPSVGLISPGMQMGK